MVGIPLVSRLDSARRVLFHAVAQSLQIAAGGTQGQWDRRSVLHQHRIPVLVHLLDRALLIPDKAVHKFPGGRLTHRQIRVAKAESEKCRLDLGGVEAGAAGRLFLYLGNSQIQHPKTLPHGQNRLPVFAIQVHRQRAAQEAQVRRRGIMLGCSGGQAAEEGHQQDQRREHQSQRLTGTFPCFPICQQSRPGFGQDLPRHHLPPPVPKRAFLYSGASTWRKKRSPPQR